MDILKQIAVFTAAGAVVSFIWHCGMYVGRLQNAVIRNADRLDDHDRRFERIEDEIRELKVG